ncbi:hypothetical protein V1511DRAFT_485475 [Dipodascopsis uninucleata]
MTIEHDILPSYQSCVEKYGTPVALVSEAEGPANGYFSRVLILDNNSVGDGFLLEILSTSFQHGYMPLAETSLVSTGEVDQVVLHYHDLTKYINRRNNSQNEDHRANSREHNIHLIARVGECNGSQSIKDILFYEPDVIMIPIFSEADTSWTKFFQVALSLHKQVVLYVGPSSNQYYKEIQKAVNDIAGRNNYFEIEDFRTIEDLSEYEIACCMNGRVLLLCDKTSLNIELIHRYFNFYIMFHDVNQSSKKIANDAEISLQSSPPRMLQRQQEDLLHLVENRKAFVNSNLRRMNWKAVESYYSSITMFHLFGAPIESPDSTRESPRFVLCVFGITGRIATNEILTLGPFCGNEGKMLYCRVISIENISSHNHNLAQRMDSRHCGKLCVMFINSLRDEAVQALRTCNKLSSPMNVHDRSFSKVSDEYVVIRCYSSDNDRCYKRGSGSISHGDDNGIFSNGIQFWIQALDWLKKGKKADLYFGDQVARVKIAGPLDSKRILKVKFGDRRLMYPQIWTNDRVCLVTASGSGDKILTGRVISIV